MVGMDISSAFSPDEDRSVVDSAFYVHFEEDARARMVRRDEDDWPVAAVALALDSPIWLEDRSFFGAVLATWTNYGW